MNDEIPVRGPAALEVLDNRDVPDTTAEPVIKVRTFEGDRQLGENLLGTPQRSAPEFSNALENSEPEDEPETTQQVQAQAAPRRREPPQVEVTFVGSFGEITAPFSSVVRQSGVLVLTQAKGQRFTFTPKRTAEGETLSLILADGTSVEVANPGITYDRACPCCGVRERAIVLLEVTNN